MRRDGYKIDSRTKQDLRNQIKELAENYTPEWNFEQKNADIGSVLALIFADQFYHNVNRFNQILERYHTEFVNLLDISLHPAHPSSAIVLMKLLSDTINGVYVEKGTRLLAEGEDSRIVFETAFPVYLSSAEMQAMFMTSVETGKILPIFGDFKKTDYAGREQIISRDGKEHRLKPFSMFEFKEKGLEQQAMLLYHSRIFDVENETLYCRITGNDEFLRKLQAGEYRFLYYSDNQFLPVEKVQVVGDDIVLIKEKENQKVLVGGKPYSMLAIEAAKPQLKNQVFDSISFSSVGGVRHADYAGNGTNDYEVREFDLFGDTLSLYSECYIGMDNYFSKQGAKISIHFHTSYKEHYVGFSKPPEEQNLKIIKRKPKIVVESMISYAYAEEISIEYYNGIGWKRLECENEYRKMFAETKEGDYQLIFTCPKDWEPTSVGGYYGRVLRIQLQRSDNCYLQPCIHRYPVLKDFLISYSYEEHYEMPEIGQVFHGTSKDDFTINLQEGKPFIGFEKGNYNDTAVYIGFDRVFENGPVSLWWKLSDVHRSMNQKLHYYYSTSSGFKEMKVVDYTKGLSKTGVMLFLPPVDLAMQEIEGKRLCWLKITREADEKNSRPIHIENIALNGIQVYNIETHDVEEFYLDTVSDNMSFDLRYTGILDAEVWVNEKDELTEEKMQQMLKENADIVRANYNYLGEIEEFFVKWEERDNFNMSVPSDRHYVLDRMGNRILFGDGIHVKIPRNTRGVAFTIQVRSCNGREGNVESGKIDTSDKNLMYVQEIYNPDPSFGGSNMETLNRALSRGASLMSSGGRFVTEQDYLDEVQNFSENIDKAAVIVGMDREGNSNESMVYIVLLMKDFMDGPVSFYQMQTEIRRHLLEQCELTISPSQLQIEEPQFVELSVDVWAQVMHIEDSFEIQNLVTDTLNQYLNPITESDHRGWDIGVLPKKSQIMMRLNALKSKAIIRQLVVTARYKDKNGDIHETDLDVMKVTRFMVVRNGKHKVHIMRAENDTDV